MERAKYEYHVDMSSVLNQKTGKVIPNRLVVFSKDMDTNYVVVSDRYSLVHNRDVVDAVRKVVSGLGYNIESEYTNLFDRGGIMFHDFITTSEYEINGTKLKAKFSAVNSYNASTLCGVSISFMDENDVMYLPNQKNNKMVYAMKSFKHHQGSVNLEGFDELASIIPEAVETTIAKWQKWKEQILSKERVKELSQLIRYQVAQRLVASGKGMSRFDFYKIICEHLLNNEKIQKSGYIQMTYVNSLNKIMCEDILFDENPSHMIERNKIIKKHQVFSWEEKENKEKKKDKGKVIADIPVAKKNLQDNSMTDILDTIEESKKPNPEPEPVEEPKAVTTKENLPEVEFVEENKPKNTVYDEILDTL